MENDNMSTTNNNHKFGTTDWNEETGPRKGFDKSTSGDNKIQYMKFVNGDNVVRVVLDPKKYITHKYKEEQDQGFGDWCKCSMPTHNSCPLCARKDRPKKRWLVGAIDRKSGQFRIMDISSAIYDQIKSLNQDEGWGDPKGYDINIVMNDKAVPANYYKVNPRAPKPLSEADLAIVKSVNEDELLRRCTPPEPEWVLSRINTIREKRNLSPLSELASSTSVVAEPQKVDASLDDADQDYVFTAHQS